MNEKDVAVDIEIGRLGQTIAGNIDEPTSIFFPKSGGQDLRYLL